MKKPAVRPHNTIRTNTPSYFFGSGKAAATNPHTKKRKPSKLPTSLDELEAYARSLDPVEEKKR